VGDNRERILDAAIGVLGADPEAGMGEVASAAGVVRRTVYGHFPSRADLVHALAERAVGEVVALFGDDESSADAAWARFVARLWPLMHRYRVLVSLRRGEFGRDIHAVLGPVERGLADLVSRGQRERTFGCHLPAAVLAQAAWTMVFSLADVDLAGVAVDASGATVASLLLLGVPGDRADDLARAATPSPGASSATPTRP